jgi:regulatory protein
MTLTTGRRTPPQLNSSSLQEMALRYVGKYATTRAKLRTYLSRKLRERGWEEERSPDVEALTDRIAELGYIDDAAYALSKSRSFAGRGYGKRRLAEKLRQDGVADADGAAAEAHADQEAVTAALRFAQRRRVGPFAAETPSPKLREKWIAAMVRAGHDFALARAIARLVPGSEPDLTELRERTKATNANPY